MHVRQPVVAGHFYPASPGECRAELDRCLDRARQLAATADAPRLFPVGGIVPHAGWVCSGAVAAGVIAALADRPGLQTVVIFGAVHRHGTAAACVFGRGVWRTPLGDVPVDEPLAAEALAAGSTLVEDPGAHLAEHSIEVQLPFIQVLAPQARLLPVMVRPTHQACEAGRAVAVAAARLGRTAVYLGSTDLTHYGPRYAFTPRGTGPEALAWASQVNDRRLIDLVLSLQAERIVEETRTHQNACGGGAVAAAVAASVAAGAVTACLLCHTTSREVLGERYGPMSDAVGYAGILLGRPEEGSAPS